jgi:hypothetical protein
MSDTNSQISTYGSEPRSLFTEECSLSNAAWVHAGEDNARILMISSIQFGNCHHVANLTTMRAS